jgi:hypothetical protein
MYIHIHTEQQLQWEFCLIRSLHMPGIKGSLPSQFNFIPYFVAGSVPEGVIGTLR